MRRAHKSNWMIDEASGNLVGINLGSDFCAEHEWGIKELENTLGLPFNKEKLKEDFDYEGVYGIERRRAKNPQQDCIAIKEEKDTLNLIVTSHYSLKCLVENSLHENSEYTFYDKKQEMVTAWNEKGFIIRVKGEKNFKKLRNLHEELVKGNVAVWLGGGGVFQNSGLCLAIIDNVSEDSKKVMKDADEDHERLYKAGKATGIKEKVDKLNEVSNGKERPFGYFSLHPAWARGDWVKKTKHPVIFWLNPMNQSKYDSGWFSVEDLEKWLKGEGPVIKKRK